LNLSSERHAVEHDDEAPEPQGRPAELDVERVRDDGTLERGVERRHQEQHQGGDGAPVQPEDHA
jgi:hypothetical protein